MHAKTHYVLDWQKPIIQRIYRCNLKTFDSDVERLVECLSTESNCVRANLESKVITAIKTLNSEIYVIHLIQSTSTLAYNFCSN